MQRVMLSSKLQKDLIDAYQKVYEEKRGHAAGSSDVEKQASQLASDVKYKAKGKVKPGASEEEKKKIFLQILQASPAPQAVKSMAKQKLLGEEVVVEDKKMSKQSDDALAAAHKKFSSMDQSTPSNKFMLKRIEKEQKKRKKVNEIGSPIYKALIIYQLLAKPRLAIIPHHQGDLELCFHLSLDQMLCCVIFFIIETEKFFELKLNKVWTQANREY